MGNIFNQADKLKHAWVCATLIVWVKTIFELFNPYGGLFNTLMAGLIVLCIAVSKELLDYITKTGIASWKDLYADIIGILSTMLPLMCI